MEDWLTKHAHDAERERQKKKDDELLAIYTLVEQNNYTSCKEAAERYMKLFPGEHPTLSIALHQLKKEFAHFMGEGR